jgi:hypothetical protein
MIQRVQSIYLLLAALAAVMTFILPFAHFLDGNTKLSEYALFGVFNVQSGVVEMGDPWGFPTWIFSAILVLLPVLAILQFKNRGLQLKLTRLTMLLNLGFVVYLSFAIQSIHNELYDAGTSIFYHAAFYMPVISLPFLFLAIRGIKKDEALVKSLDRIR